MISAKSDDPTTFAPWIIKDSEGGTACTTFKDCAALAKKGEDIDYNGSLRSHRDGQDR